MVPLDTDPLRPGQGQLLALDLGTTTGWALRLATGQILHGSVSFRPSRFDGGGMRFVRFSAWLDTLITDTGGLEAIYFEEVRRHLGVDAAHLYGGFLATLTAWCEHRAIAYQGDWLPTEVYLQRRFGLRVSHGISDAEAERIRAQLPRPDIPPVDRASPAD